MQCLATTRSAVAAGVLAFVGVAAGSEATACDLDLPRFDPATATAATASPRRTRIPASIGVEHAGFATQDAAAKCFGHRYHHRRNAEYVTVIVPVADGWGYLTPGKGARKTRKVRVRPLLQAYRDAGFRLTALAHTHPFGAPHFSTDDLVATVAAGVPFYMTNWRNETYRVDPALLDAHTGARRPSGTRAMRRLARAKGFPGDRID